MKRIVLTPEQLAVIDGAGERIQLTDPAGNVVGAFFPARSLYPGITQEELERRLNSDEVRFSTAQVIALLRSGLFG